MQFQINAEKLKDHCSQLIYANWDKFSFEVSFVVVRNLKKKGEGLELRMLQKLAFVRSSLRILLQFSRIFSGFYRPVSWASVRHAVKTGFTPATCRDSTQTGGCRLLVPHRIQFTARNKVSSLFCFWKTYLRSCFDDSQNVCYRFFTHFF